jgi:hypothetical protein
MDGSNCSVRGTPPQTVWLVDLDPFSVHYTRAASRYLGLEDGQKLERLQQISHGPNVKFACIDDDDV